MLHLLQERFLLLQQLSYLPFGGAPVGNIFDSQENQRGRVSLIEYPRMGPLASDRFKEF
jgi:hypothetical protein